jgi:hypothetical protein
MRSISVSSKAGLRSAVVAAICGAAAIAAQAQAVYFSGPSVARANVAATFEGGNFKANLPVTVVVLAPNGAESSYGSVASAEGKLSFSLLPVVKGNYRLTVTGTDGKPLAAATLIANP